MSKKQIPNKTNKRKEGRHFAPLSEKDEDETSNQGKVFTPNDDEVLTEAPESITAGERLPSVSEYTGIRLEALPVKGLKTFTYSLILLIICMVCWETYRVVVSALDQHWLLATGFISLIIVVTTLGLKQLVNYFRKSDNQTVLNRLRQHANRLKQGQDFGHSSHFIEDLKLYYSEKPQAVYLKRSLETLADYSNDKEAIDHIERSFLEPLDQEALRRVSNLSVKTGVVVTISPWGIIRYGTSTMA